MKDVIYIGKGLLSQINEVYMYNDLWKELFKAHIDEAEAINRLVREHNMENSQEYIDWQDKLNEISVR